MKGFYHSPSQHMKMGHNETKLMHGSHIITTEAQTLEQALHIIEVKQRQKKASRAMIEASQHPTLAQELARAAFFAKGRNISLANGDVHLGRVAQRSAKTRKEREARHVPHPYRDLPEETKPAKARAMFASGNWGTGAAAGRRIALLFGVDRATMTEWLGIKIWTTVEYDRVHWRE